MAASVAHDLQEIPSDGGEVLRNGMWIVFFSFLANLVYYLKYWEPFCAQASFLFIK